MPATSSATSSRSLGDGRANLLGEVVGRDGIRRDIQLKGSGPTPFSRRGDGRAALGPVLREYLVSEAMAALGVPTTRTLAAVTTGEPVWRETMLPGAVLTRVAASHIRVGTFQYLAAQGDDDGVRLTGGPRDCPPLPGGSVGRRSLPRLARWRRCAPGRPRGAVAAVGFIHGVMNTDNMSIAGETIDYGPCAFMDAYDPGSGVQFHRPAGPLRLRQSAPHRAVEPDPAGGVPAAAAEQRRGGRGKQALLAFAPRFQAAYFAGLRRKIGLVTPQDDLEEGDDILTQDLLKLMAADAADFTLTFRLLCDAATGPQRDAPVRTQFKDAGAYDAWATRWRARLAAESAPQTTMRAANPAFIPRNHLVEAAITAAVERGDYQPFEHLMAVLSRPYQDDPAQSRYAAPPREEERVRQTFCGT